MQLSAAFRASLAGSQLPDAKANIMIKSEFLVNNIVQLLPLRSALERGVLD